MFWILLTISFFGVLIFSVLLTKIQNHNAVESSQSLFEAVIAERLERISDLVLEYGYWDEAVNHLIVERDLDWIASNMGAYLYETLGVTEALVFDGDHMSVFSSIEGEVSPHGMAAALEGGLDDLITAAQASPDHIEPVPVVGFLKKDDEIFLAAAVRMTTYFTVNDREVDRSTDHVMVFKQILDEDFLAGISERFMLPNLRMAGSREGLWQAEFPITTYDGAINGVFVWEPRLPGMEMLPKLIGGLVVVFVAMVFTAFSFFRKAGAAASVLDDARQEADRANAAKSEFLRNVAHEVRTPANAILGFASIMEQGMFGPLGHTKYTEYARDIGRAGGHVMAVTDDLLNLARIEAGEVEPSIAVLNVEEALSSAVALVKNQAEENQISLVLDVPEHLPTVRTDARLLTQVLLNLLSNAVKFTPEGGLIKCRADRASDGALSLLVEDNGPGIAPEDIHRVLEPFGQIQSMQREGFGGTGLGLPIARKLTEALGGRFGFQSTVGRGTTVTVTLPAD
jgi:signal transduction histidine kinase